MMNSKQAKFFVGALTLLAGPVAVQAQSAGAIIGRVSVTQIAPDVTSGDLSAPSFTHTQVDVKADTQPTAGLTWMWTDNIAIDLPLALGFKHDIVGAGAIAGVGKIGETKALPVTLLAQYRFGEPGSTVRPYAGLGPVYAKFYKERTTAALTGLTGGTAADPTTMHIDSRFGMAVQLGLSVALAPRWGLDAAMLKTKLKTKATLSSGQTIDVKLDPMVYTVGVTYQF